MATANPRHEKKNLVLYRGVTAYVIMNRYPYANGHLMVIPYRHTDDFLTLTEEEHTELGLLLAKAQYALTKAFHPQGFNIGMNMGTAGGAGIKEHLHYHIVPRWNGDHNFMPVCADLKVMLESLPKTYDRLKKYF